MPLTMFWWKPTLDCPTCHGKASIVDFLYSSDGEVKLNMLCIPCGKSLQWVSNYASLIRDSFARDIKLAQINKELSNVAPALPSMPVSPPILLGAPPKHLSEEDRIEMHGMGIVDDEKGEAA